MHCEEIRRLTGPYLDGELDPPLGRAVEDHLRTCVPCAAERDAIAGLGRTLARTPPEAPFGAAFAARVADRAFAARRRSTRRGGILRITRARRAVAGAAAVAAATLLVVLALGPGREPTTPRGASPAPGQASPDRRAGPGAAGAGEGASVVWTPPPPLIPTRTLSLADGSRIGVAGGTDFEEGGGVSGFEGLLLSGRVEALVAPQTGGRRFRIRTPGALVTVLGTRFVLAYDPERRRTALFVYEGRVRITPEGAGQEGRDFTAGLGVSFGPEGFPTVPPAPADATGDTPRDAPGDAVDLPRRG